MKKLLLIFFLSAAFLSAQTTDSITAAKIATFTVPNSNIADSTAPYYKYLGVRRVIVADANSDGEQEVIATDYTNGGRVHVLKIASDSLMEIIWSSPAYESASGSTPRFPQVGDCDGDGNLEIIFEQRNFPNDDGSEGRIALYEWNGTDWGSEPAFSITPTMLEAAGGREGMRFHREVLTVYDFDNDGRSEIVPHGNSPRKDVLILGVENSFPGFASIVIEGGKPGTQTNGGDWGAGGSFWNAEVADINGDGDIEIINHTWNNYGFWSIDVAGKDTYIYPDSVDTRAMGGYNEYCDDHDAVSYFGVKAADVDGDGKDEIVGTQYKNAHAIAMISFADTVDEVYPWTEASKTENYVELFQSKTVAALAGKPSAQLWPIVKGDLNQDGKDELYTGGANGLNLVAIQYKGEGSVLDSSNYMMNLVYDGKGGNVFAEWDIYNGKTTYEIDTLNVGTDSLRYDTTNVTFDPSVIDTFKTELPFTAYIYADSVDLDGDGKLEIVIADQNIYDSIKVNFYNWSDSLGLGLWELDTTKSHKIFNAYRQTMRVLEFTGQGVGLAEHNYGIITPNDYKLEQNYPNPFNPTTTINYTLPIDKKVSLKIYNMLGQEIKTLVSNELKKKGTYQVMWNGKNNFGTKVASGHYIAKLIYGNFSKSIKMTLMK
ncbi:MAG: hypothetical protein CR986_06230 [Ignavibacteriae bacterium]|nr:MAG: hypothetical protein CR986_06230 [Ignavibacteriota bacterium]